jgi:DNA mismatch repair protein MLH1
VSINALILLTISIPANYLPSLSKLPMYIVRIATDVDWDNEKECFQTFCRETAQYFSKISNLTPENDWKWLKEHVLFPAIRKNLLPPKRFSTDNSILKLTSLPDLYKVFERC